MKLTEESLRDVCLTKKLYRTPNVNDKLWLHYMGISKLENLEEYSGIKVAWLEGNAISKIEGLDTMTLLQTLYLQENCIRSPIRGLDCLLEIRTLNLADNDIDDCGGFSHLPHLSTLSLKNNRITTIAPLLGCNALSVLDVSGNRIEKDEATTTMATLELLPSLAVLYLSAGNSVAGAYIPYRKLFTVRLRGLRYLDDRPVFKVDRRCHEAWFRGGLEAEKQARQRERDEDRIRTLAGFACINGMHADPEVVAKAREYQMKHKEAQDRVIAEEEARRQTLLAGRGDGEEGQQQQGRLSSSRGGVQSWADVDEFSGRPQAPVGAGGSGSEVDSWMTKAYGLEEEEVGDEKNDKSESDRAPRVSSSVEADEAMAGGYEYYDVNEGSDEEEGADEEGEGEGEEGSGGGVEATTADGKADKEEEEEEEEVTEREVLFEERDVQILMDQANVSERLARAALVRHQGDMVAAVVDIQAAALSAGAAHSSNHGERDSALAAVPAGGTGGPVMHRFPSLPAQRAQPPPRPQVFGTGLYKSLWNRATADIGDDQTLSTSDVESVPGTADGQSVSDDEGALSDTSQGGAGAALADGTDVDGLD